MFFPMFFFSRCVYFVWVVLRNTRSLTCSSSGTSCFPGFLFFPGIFVSVSSPGICLFVNGFSSACRSVFLLFFNVCFPPDCFSCFVWVVLYSTRSLRHSSSRRRRSLCSETFQWVCFSSVFFCLVPGCILFFSGGLYYFVFFVFFSPFSMFLYMFFY